MSGMRPSGAVVMLCAFHLAAAELPVREVILYKHGVGYFARGGTLGAGESARLDFRPSEMNDVLKSLILQEKNGGKIAGVRYDSDIPLAEKLSDFPFKLGDGKSLTAVLDQLKGSRLEMQLGAERVNGLVVAARIVSGDKDRAEREQVTLLLDGGDLRNFDLAAAATIRFTDIRLQSQFKDYLMAVTAARSTDRRSVYIDSTDARSREVAASYVIPTPIWKSSYRLILDAAGQPILEGWAIIDNTTGEDWINVRMSLVSGKPISFISQLYEPRNVPRRTADLPELAALAPVVYQGAMGSTDKDAKLFVPGAGQTLSEQMGITAKAGPFTNTDGTHLGTSSNESPNSFARLEKFARLPANSTVAPTATGREAADLFEYSIPSAVTVKKNESAMLPFLQKKIGGRKLSIYSDTSSQHPLNAAELTNSTGMTLDGGPITVYDDGVYAGEALMETLKSADKRIISYGVDLGTRITTAFDAKAETVREIRAARGTLTVKQSRMETMNYDIRNVDAKAKTLLIEQPANPGYTVVSPKPIETTPAAWRFQIDLPANAPAKIATVLRCDYDLTLEVSTMTPDIVAFWAQNQTLSGAARAQLQQLGDLKRQLAEASKEMGNNESEVSSISRDEERSRQNIATLSNVSGQQEQVQNYARQLAQYESRINTLHDRHAALEQQKTALQKQIDDAVEKMSF